MDSLEGAPVTWEGYVLNVTQSELGGRISVTIARMPDRRVDSGVILPEAWRAKAFSLQPGDRVRSRGTLDVTPGGFPLVHATDLQVVAPTPRSS